MHSALRLNLFTLSAPTVNLTLTRRLWMGFALMALLTLTSTTVGWYNLRFISRGKRQHSGIDSYHEYGAPVERSQRPGTFRRAEPDQCR